MSIRYHNIDCPICGKPLDTGNVVVCPDCGAPYHLDCYKNSGTCIFPDLHRDGASWKPPFAPMDESTIDGNAPLRCQRCNTVNPATGLFCQVCGTPLNENENQPDNLAQQGGFMPPGMPFNPFTTPFGGLADDEIVDEVPVKDLAIFVGKNSHYYLPRFKQMSGANGKAKTINWAAFFFAGGFFVYRKMYGIGIIALLVNFILYIPYMIMLYTAMTTASPLQNSSIDVNMITMLNMVANVLILGLRFACGLMGNTMYKKHTYEKISKIKSKSQSTDDYLANIRRSGGVATKLVYGFLIGYVVLYLLSMIYALL